MKYYIPNYDRYYTDGEEIYNRHTNNMLTTNRFGQVTMIDDDNTVHSINKEKMIKSTINNQDYYSLVRRHTKRVKLNDEDTKTEDIKEEVDEHYETTDILQYHIDIYEYIPSARNNLSSEYYKRTLSKEEFELMFGNKKDIPMIINCILKRPVRKAISEVWYLVEEN
jgi:hypothetical protein